MTKCKHSADGPIEVTTSGDNKFVLETNADGRVFKKGRTTKSPHQQESEEYLKINYSAEMWGPTMLEKLKLCCCKCSCIDMNRSYTYIREDALENNFAHKRCCGLFKTQDDVKVQFFDRPPKFDLPFPIGKERVTDLYDSQKCHEPGKMAILYDAEVLPADCCTRIYLGFMCCGIYSTERSYLRIRENSLEANTSYAKCCGKCAVEDDISVTYFDNGIFKRRKQMCVCYKCCPIMCTTVEPTVDVIQRGCQCCCVSCPCGLCFSGCFQQQKVVIMPYETCCMCCTNRTSKAICCCGGNCYGGGFPFGFFDIAGNPIIYDDFNPQPKDAHEFSAYLRYALSKEDSRKDTEPVGIVYTGSGTPVAPTAC